MVLYARKFAKSYVKRYKHKVWLASSLRSRYGRLTAGPACAGLDGIFCLLKCKEKADSLEKSRKWWFGLKFRRMEKGLIWH